MSSQLSGSIKLANSEQEIAACYPVMLQLRPHLHPDKFTTQVKSQMAEGYQLAYFQEDQIIHGVAGFHISQSLSWGKYLYVADLVVDHKSRSHGYGTALIKWLVAHAKNQKCHQLHLDSGVQRFAAHRFYLRHRMNISAHHFTLKLEAE